MLFRQAHRLTGAVGAAVGAPARARGAEVAGERAGLDVLLTGPNPKRDELPFHCKIVISAATCTVFV